MKHVKVSELKAHLSEHLAAVRRGETVVVCDRRTPIALLAPYEDGLEDLRVEEPRRPKTELAKVRGVRPRRRIDLDRTLRETRGER